MKIRINYGKFDGIQIPDGIQIFSMNKLLFHIILFHFFSILISKEGFDHQERTVQSDSSQIVTVNLETIIVQEETQGTCKQPVCDGTRWGINCIWEDAVRSTQSRHPEHCNYRISSGNCPMC